MKASETDRTITETMRREFNTNRHPDSQFVSREIYEAIERVILDWVEQMDRDYPLEFHSVKIGPRGGLMFKNVELLLAEQPVRA